MHEHVRENSFGGAENFLRRKIIVDVEENLGRKVLADKKDFAIFAAIFRRG